MISLPEFKVLIGPLAEKLTDDEIEQLRDMEYQIADAVIEYWLTKRKEEGGTATMSEYNIPSIEF